MDNPAPNQPIITPPQFHDDVPPPPPAVVPGLDNHPPPTEAVPPPPPPPKKWGKGALVGSIAAVFLIVASVVTGLTLYQRRNQAVAPTAPKPGKAFSNIKESGTYPSDSANHFGFDGNCFTLHLETINTTKYSCAGKNEADPQWTSSTCNRNQADGHADPALRCFTTNYCGVQKIVVNDGTVTTDRVKINSGPDCHGTLSWSVNLINGGFEVDVSGDHGAFTARADFSPTGSPNTWQNPQQFPHAAGTGPTTYTFMYNPAPAAGQWVRARVLYNNLQVAVLELPLIAASPSPSPSPSSSPTTSFQCQEVKVFRAGVQIQPANIKLGDTIIFRGFASTTNMADPVHKLKFTLTKGGVALTPVEENAILVGTLYQADYQIVIDHATSYSVTATAGP